MAALYKSLPPRESCVRVSEDHLLRVYVWGPHHAQQQPHTANHPPPPTLLYIHGGPGGGTPPDLPRLFDTTHLRIVAFDQRGCGRSEAADRLRHNTLDHLVADVEAVRAALGIDTWGVMGSSYGVLVAALYVARHSEAVAFALLHGVFLGSADEIDWLFRPGGAARFYPLEWEALEACRRRHAVSDDESDGASEGGLRTWHRILCATAGAGDDRDRHPPPRALEPGLLDVAKAIAKWEDDLETLEPEPATHTESELIAGAQIAMHHLCGAGEPGFCPPDGAADELAAARSALARTPCTILHGRHDVICTPRAALKLHRLWPGSELRIVEGGAHALFSRKMRTAARQSLVELLPGSDTRRKRAGR